MKLFLQVAHLIDDLQPALVASRRAHYHQVEAVRADVDSRDRDFAVCGRLRFCRWRRICGCGCSAVRAFCCTLRCWHAARCCEIERAAHVMRRLPAVGGMGVAVGCRIRPHPRAA